MGESRPPPYVICHLCGRKYGTKSIAIHVPQCEKKWYAENKKLPKDLRRRLPTQPDYGILQSGDFNSGMIDQMNEMSFKAAQAQLIPCENCGRTFYPEKLPVHQKSCTIDKPARAPTRCKTSSSVRNTDRSYQNGNVHNEEIKSKLRLKDMKNGDIEKTKHVSNEKDTQQCGDIKSRYTSSNNIIPTILCAICMEQIPAKRIQVHLVHCNEEKIKCIQQTGTCKESEDENTRPRTRTIRRVSDTGTYDIIKPNGNVEKPDAIDSSHFIPCELCNRRFKEDRINQHKVICSKVKKKERKTFDSSKQRLQGIEASGHNQSTSTKNRNKEQTNVSTSNWKQRHQEFIQAIRAAKQVTAHVAKGGKVSDIPPPPPSLNPDYIHCKYCDRRFNPEVASRHIPKCATIMNRPAPPKNKALDIYKDQTKNKGLKKSETFSVSDGKSKNRFSQKEKAKATDFSGYVSPRLETRYDSFERTGRMNNNNNVYRSLTSLDCKANDDSDSSSKEKYLTRQKLLKKQGNTVYSYNSVKKKTQPKKDFSF